MKTLRLTNGITVHLRIRRAMDGSTCVVAAAEEDARTLEYDREYRQSIAQFEAAWRTGVRGDSLQPPETGAEVFMTGLWCERLAHGAPQPVRLTSSWVGGTGTEWQVRWNTAVRPGDRFRVGDAAGNAVELHG